MAQDFPCPAPHSKDARQRKGSAVPPDNFQQQLCAEGLAEDPFGADIPRAIGHGRDDDDRDARQGSMLPLLSPKLPAIHHRHHQVQEDQLRPFLSTKVVERFPPVRNSNDPIAFFFEHFLERRANLRVVVDDQHQAR